MMITLVTMFVMTMSANAQSKNNNGLLDFNRMSSYLDAGAWRLQEEP